MILANSMKFCCFISWDYRRKYYHNASFVLGLLSADQTDHLSPHSGFHWKLEKRAGILSISHISNICSSSFYYLYNLHVCMSHQSAISLIHAFITSKLDYCNYSLLYDLPTIHIKTSKSSKCCMQRDL